MWRADTHPGSPRAGFLGVLLLVLSGGCAFNPARGWLPSAQEAPANMYGAWIEVGPRRDALAGEFLAFDRDSVFVLTHDARVQAVAAAHIAEARIFWYDSKWGSTTALWGLLGSLSTFSHGFGLIATMPVWILVSSVSSAADSRAPIVRPTRAGWDAARAYARYPAGLPPDLPRTLPLVRSTR